MSDAADFERRRRRGICGVSDQGVAARRGSSRELPAPRGRAYRLAHLDSLRGVAAFVVVLHHALLSLPGRFGETSFLPAAGIVVLGRPAVILFFVLSGFVLMLCMGTGQAGIVSFAARRLIRLVPTFWFAIALSFAAFTLVPHRDAVSMSRWFNDQWGGVITPADLGRHLLMIAGPRQYPLDHVAWSLVHELRLSLVLPIMAVIAARSGVIAFVLSMVALSLAAELYVSTHAGDFPVGAFGFHFDAQGLSHSMILTARFAAAFAIGLSLALRARSLSLIYARPLVRPLSLGAALLCLSFDNEGVMTLGAALLVSGLASSTMTARALEIAPLAWLGRVSYSLYLIHLPIMLALGLLLDGIVPAPASLALAILVALAASELMCRFAEEPSIRWSRNAARHLASRRVRAPISSKERAAQA